jgi:hypothetical protein
MGIKDWLSSIGDKSRKQAELRERVKEAVSDGRLSATDVQDIRSLQAELEVDPPAADKTQVRRALFQDAFDAVRNKGVTATGIHELHKIQKFLGLRDDQLDKAKFEMQRLRTLAEIRKGSLPQVSSASVALRDVPLEEGEVAHYTMSVDILDQPSTRGADGLAVAWGTPYPEGGARPHVLPEDGAREVGEATLVITNRRLVLKTAKKIAAVPLSAQAQISLYSDGLRLQRTVGNTLLRFRSGSDETSEIVGEILAAVMRPA